MTAAPESKKSTDHTVFVRFVPPSSNLRRHHLEAFFSEVGPIKKSSVVVPRHGDDETRASSSYGFVKYTAHQDAVRAVKKCHGKSLQISPTEHVQLKVELASQVAAPKKKRQPQASTAQRTTTTQIDEKDDPHALKKTSRLILRNLSFYAKESVIRKMLQERFGPVSEVHLPTVSGKSRGFGFVTFENPDHAQACVEAAASTTTKIEIAKRPVHVEWSQPKTLYEQQKQQQGTGTSKKRQAEIKEEVVSEKEESDDSDSDSDDGKSDESDEQDEVETEEEDDDDKNESEEQDADERDQEDQPKKDDSAVAEKRSLFVRNLPFDATRQDLFELFRKFGHITAIYLVKDSATGMPKGTAFVSFKKTDQAAAAVQAAAESNDFVSQRQATSLTPGDAAAVGALTLKGRRLFCDWAVDKETASTLAADKTQDTRVGKDKRNLYLKMEGRVDNNEGNQAWDELPPADQAKRQTAWSDKNTKLRSPLFFINPNRLSIRNLAKSVDEAALKQLCLKATQRGLKHVSAQDQIAHWRASGEWSTRDILQKMQEYEETGNGAGAMIPPIDTKNVKAVIPSVFIARDVFKDQAPSRGFGFVEFTHHVHALACLRELNNNVQYSRDHVAGGKAKAGLTPRLILEFAVENKAKAKQQSEHKAQKEANTRKQRKEHHVEQKEDKKAVKKSRGARQRERKRRKGSEQTEEAASPQKPAAAPKAETTSTTRPVEKAMKPPKKKPKTQTNEQSFSALVDSYKQQFQSEASTATTNSKKGKRWFE